MPRVTGSSATRSGQQHVRGVGKGEKLPPPNTATSTQTTGSSTARMHQKGRLDVEDDVFASSVDDEEVTSTEEVSSDEGNEGVPGEDLTENEEEDSDDGEEDDDRSGSGSSRASDDDSVSETESDALESTRTGAPVSSNGSRSSNRGKGGSADNLPNNFHGYACHKCGGGVGWNAKRCRKCKTPVRKPNQRRPDEPPLPPPPAVDVTATPKVMRSKRGRDPVPAADSAIPPAVAAMAAALSADPTFQAIQRASTDVSPVHTPAPVVAPAPAPLDHDDVQIVASKGEVKVVSSTGAVAHLTTQREGYSYMHSVSRSKTLPPAPVFAPLSLLDSFSVEQIDHHCRSLQAETFQRRFRPLIIRLMEHSANAGVFNAPVQPHELGILDYFAVCCSIDGAKVGLLYAF